MVDRNRTQFLNDESLRRGPPFTITLWRTQVFRMAALAKHGQRESGSSSWLPPIESASPRGIRRGPEATLSAYRPNDVLNAAGHAGSGESSSGGGGMLHPSSPRTGPLSLTRAAESLRRRPRWYSRDPDLPSSQICFDPETSRSAPIQRRTSRDDPETSRSAPAQRRTSGQGILGKEPNTSSEASSSNEASSVSSPRRCRFHMSSCVTPPASEGRALLRAAESLELVAPSVPRPAVGARATTLATASLPPADSTRLAVIRQIMSLAQQEQEQREAWRNRLSHELVQSPQRLGRPKETEREMEERKRIVLAQQCKELHRKHREAEEASEQEQEDSEQERQRALLVQACEPLYKLTGLLPNVNRRQGLFEIYFEYWETKAVGVAVDKRASTMSQT